MGHRQRERINQTGHAYLLCPFHKEWSPSLRVWPNGGFYCLGCHQAGWLSQHPELARRYQLLKEEHPALRNTSQYCFPWRGVEVWDMPDEAPKPTGRYRDVSLSGCLFAWKEEQPVFMRMPGSTSVYLPIFTMETKLHQAMTDIKIESYSIKKIDNGSEFLSSIPTEIVVIIDPYRVEGPEERLRWMEIPR